MLVAIKCYIIKKMAINKEKIHELLKNHSVELAYIFGSFATGGATKRSDIDIAVLLPSLMKKERRFDARLKLMEGFSKIFGKKAEVVILNDTSSLFFKYIIIKEGEKIYQKNEEERIDFENKITGEYFDFAPFLKEYNLAYVKRNL